jgi:two-component sensor histidine kinase
VVQYGALSNAAGRVEIRTTANDRKLKLPWTQRGGPLEQQPLRRCFGTRLIDRLAEQLHSDILMKYEPMGLVYELDVVLSALRERHVS